MSYCDNLKTKTRLQRDIRAKAATELLARQNDEDNELAWAALSGTFPTLKRLPRGPGKRDEYDACGYRFYSHKAFQRYTDGLPMYVWTLMPQRLIASQMWSYGMDGILSEQCLGTYLLQMEESRGFFARLFNL